jgi:hypothetical protein
MALAGLRGCGLCSQLPPLAWRRASRLLIAIDIHIRQSEGVGGR